MDTSHGNQPCNSTDYTDGAAQREYAVFVQDHIKEIDQRYHEPALRSIEALVEQIGKDLNSSSEETGVIASITRSYVCAVLGGYLKYNLLDEREKHWEDWRHERGRDQSFVNEAMDCFSQLNSTFVKNDEQTEEWEQIGEELSNPSQERRKNAFDKAISLGLQTGEFTNDDLDWALPVYIALVEKGGFNPNVSKDPRPYFHRARSNWSKDQQRNEKRITHLTDKDWQTPPDHLLGILSVPAVEEVVLDEISESSLYHYIIEQGLIKEAKFSLFYAATVGELKPRDLAPLFCKTAHAISQELSEINKKILLLRDGCIVNKILRGCLAPNNFETTTDDFSDHSSEFAKGVSDSFRSARDTLALMDSSKSVFLPLTSFIGDRPGRLYIFNGSVQQVRANLYKYLHMRGTDPLEYDMVSLPFTSWSSQYNTTRFPILDEIIKRVREHGRPHLGLLNMYKGKKELKRRRQKTARMFPDNYNDPILLLNDIREWRWKNKGPIPDVHGDFVEDYVHIRHRSNVYECGAFQLTTLQYDLQSIAIKGDIIRLA